MNTTCGFAMKNINFTEFLNNKTPLEYLKSHGVQDDKIDELINKWRQHQLMIKMSNQALKIMAENPKINWFI